VTACGYRSARPAFSQVEVEAIATDVPQPEVAACLTRELRLGLAARGVRVERHSSLRLEGELRRAEARPGAVAMAPNPVAVDQRISLTLRLRLVDRLRGVVWGPTNIRVERRAALGPSGLASAAAADQGLLRACHEAADQALLELTLARIPGDLQRTR
jgi:hypothetical protein